MRANDPNLPDLRRIAEALGDLREQVVFVGGSVADLLAWVEGAQPDSYQRLSKTHGPALPKVLAKRVRKSLNERGTLDVLRRGVEMLGLSAPLLLAQFKPALALNPDIDAHYAPNQLRVVRQVCHSPNNPKAE